MPARSFYFVNWWFDGLAIGGLSILAWIGLGVLWDGGSIAPIATSALALNFFVNYPHFSATVYRLYQSPDNTKQFPVTSWVVPLVLLGAVFASFWQPQSIAPYFVLLYVLWSPYHYSGQTLGITMVYARRCGFPVGRRERLALAAFIFSTFVCAVIRVQETSLGGAIIDTRGIPVPALAFPSWMYPGAQAVMWTGALVFAAFALAWCLKQKRLLPPIVLLPAAAQFVWFVPGAGIRSFLVIVPLFHSLQYLLVAAIMQVKVRADAAAGEPSRRWIRSEVVRWGVRNIAGGILLFVALPLLFAGTGVPALTAFAILTAAVNIHHFFVDGVIWKLRDASTSSALMTSLAELGGPAPALAAGIARA
jgi:hypothetical protein